MAVPLSWKVGPAAGPASWGCFLRHLMKILIVDDDHDLLEALGLGLQLQWQDALVVTASDGEMALRLFDDEVPDVVLLDVGLPRLDGFEVLRRIRATSDTPVLMLTARGEELDK